MKTKSTIYRLILIGAFLVFFICGKIENIEKFTKSSIMAEFNSIETSESSSGTVIDIDGNIYHTVTIGNQVWMTENLKTTRYRNGDAIFNVKDSKEWSALAVGAYCWYNNISRTYKTDYGALYNWYVVNDIRNIAPLGWHVPTDTEWNTLADFLGGWEEAGCKLKETGTTHWLTPNTGATNSTGFTSIPGGLRNFDGTFFDIGSTGGYWSSTEYSYTYAWSRDMFFDDGRASGDCNLKVLGFSVRCLRD